MSRPALLLALAALSLPALGCGAGGDGGTISPGDEVAVYVSVPGTGPLAGAGRDVLAGARLALDERGAEAGGARVRIAVVDPAGPAGNRSPEAVSLPSVAGNARRAAADSAAVAYIGDLRSAATEVSLAVTNQARLAQISPSSTAGELVRPLPGSSALPRAQDTGQRTFARVVPSAEAVDRIAEQTAQAIRGPSQIPAPPPEAVADAGLDALPSARSGEAVVGLALDPDDLRGAPRRLERSYGRFSREFRRHEGREPGPLAAYGYEAMALALGALGEVVPGRGTRRDVAEAMLGALREGGPLGRFRIGAAGETDLDLVGWGRIGEGGGVETLGVAPPRHGLISRLENAR